jgi:hypothetical protein
MTCDHQWQESGTSKKHDWVCSKCKILYTVLKGLGEDKYTYTTHGTARVQLDKGTYTLEKLKELVAALEQMNKAAHASMQPTKEIT